MSELHPVQTAGRYSGGYISSDVTRRAYEVYCHVHRPQPALITGECRGGFSTGELIAFLYARSFPKTEWSARVGEAFAGAKDL
jgi:hypothetical protein